MSTCLHQTLHCCTDVCVSLSCDARRADSTTSKPKSGKRNAALIQVGSVRTIVFLASCLLAAVFAVAENALRLVEQVLLYVQDITSKWETIRHPNTTATQRLEIVHEIMQQV